MKRLLCIIVLILTSAALIFYSASTDLSDLTSASQKEWQMTELGIPSGNTYSIYRLAARNPWDMTVFDGKLYIGGGDYDLNTGPAAVWRYTFETHEWQNSGLVNDEAVQKFIELDGQLIIPGTDPTTSHEYGSYYRLGQDGQWQTVRNVPYGVHMFDIVQHNGETFYAIGNADSTQSPVQKTSDGNTFQNTQFYADDKALVGDPSVGFSRCYGLFTVSDKLFALCRWYTVDAFGFFEYDGTNFNLVATVKSLNLTDVNVNRQSLLNEKATFQNKCYISFGSFYCTDDFKTLERITVPDDAVVQDIVISDGKMYVLTSLKISEPSVADTVSDVASVTSENSETADTQDTESTDLTYRNTVWEYSEQNSFTKVFSFDYGMSAMSFCKYNEVFFVGIGDTTSVSPDSDALNGTILMFY